MLRTNLSLIVAKNLAAFTMLEAMVGIAVLGIGAASTIGALTKFNSIAAISRNATGAYTVVMNQIDSFQSMSPFNPQKTNPDGTPQIPKDLVNNPPTYDMTVGTHTIGYAYKDANGVPRVSNQWPVYQYKNPSTGMTVVVNGTLTVAVTDVSATTAPNTYMAVVTITYNYLNHDGIHQPNYSFSMTAIRTSDI
jgi:type II secretory pathway pseudopilin PulG